METSEELYKHIIGHKEYKGNLSAMLDIKNVSDAFPAAVFEKIPENINNDLKNILKKFYDNNILGEDINEVLDNISKGHSLISAYPYSQAYLKFVVSAALHRSALNYKTSIFIVDEISGNFVKNLITEFSKKISFINTLINNEPIILDSTEKLLNINSSNRILLINKSFFLKRFEEIVKAIKSTSLSDFFVDIDTLIILPAKSIFDIKYFISKIMLFLKISYEKTFKLFPEAQLMENLKMHAFFSCPFNLTKKTLKFFLTNLNLSKINVIENIKIPEASCPLFVFQTEFHYEKNFQIPDLTRPSLGSMFETIKNLCTIIYEQWNEYIVITNMSEQEHQKLEQQSQNLTGKRYIYKWDKIIFATDIPENLPVIFIGKLPESRLLKKFFSIICKEYNLPYFFLIPDEKKNTRRELLSFVKNEGKILAEINDYYPLIPEELDKSIKWPAENLIKNFQEFICDSKNSENIKIDYGKFDVDNKKYSFIKIPIEDKDLLAYSKWCFLEEILQAHGISNNICLTISNENCLLLIFQYTLPYEFIVNLFTPDIILKFLSEIIDYLINCYCTSGCIFCFPKELENDETIKEKIIKELSKILKKEVAVNTLIKWRYKNITDPEKIWKLRDEICKILSIKFGFNFKPYPTLFLEKNDLDNIKGENPVRGLCYKEGQIKIAKDMNEIENLAVLSHELGHNYAFESDDYNEIFENLRENFPWFNIKEVKENIGYFRGIYFSEAFAEFISFHIAQELRLVEILETIYKFHKGSEYGEGLKFMLYVQNEYGLKTLLDFYKNPKEQENSININNIEAELANSGVVPHILDKVSKNRDDGKYQCSKDEKSWQNDFLKATLYLKSIDEKTSLTGETTVEQILKNNQDEEILDLSVGSLLQISNIAKIFEKNGLKCNDCERKKFEKLKYALCLYSDKLDSKNLFNKIKKNK